ncbi:MAG: hypothetical protein E7376_01145 [Clostridiales bacterium]|nr:hypothetical protein [Clostridiales bacterium]
MKEFQTMRNGYNKNEVDAYISELEEQILQKNAKIEQLNSAINTYQEKEKDINEKSQNISIALTAAVEKAKQIENSSKNVYNLKIEELQILYARWEKVLNELVQKYPNLDEIDNVKKLLLDFKAAIKASLKEDFKFTNSNVSVMKESDPMRALLGKMNTYLDKQVAEKKEVKTKTHARKQLSTDMLTKQTELNKLEEKSTMIKPIYNARLEDGEKYNSLLDKFLTEDAPTDSVYANKLTSKVAIMPPQNESGFDLKEAVNPKDSLEAIMKSFNFFTEE